MENTGPLVQVKLYLQTAMTKLKILNGERRETAIKKMQYIAPKIAGYIQDPKLDSSRGTRFCEETIATLHCLN